MWDKIKNAGGNIFASVVMIGLVILVAILLVKAIVWAWNL